MTRGARALCSTVIRRAGPLGPCGSPDDPTWSFGYFKPNFDSLTGEFARKSRSCWTRLAAEPTVEPGFAMLSRPPVWGHRFPGTARLADLIVRWWRRRSVHQQLHMVFLLREKKRPGSARRQIAGQECYDQRDLYSYRRAIGPAAQCGVKSDVNHPNEAASGKCTDY